MASNRAVVRGDHPKANSLRTFQSVRDLIKTINDYSRHYNKIPQPFQWVASASTIVRKVNKYKGSLDAGKLATRRLER